MPSRLETAVTGGSPNLLGSLTAAARPLPENADWHAFGTSHIVENCGLPWVWQKCTVADNVNEVQALLIENADGGTFTLTFDPFGNDPQTTAPIAYNATPAAVQAALELLSNVDPGDIVVGGVSGDYTFTFGGQYEFTNVAQMEADGSLLTGEGATATVTTTTEGGSEKPLNPGVDAVNFDPFLVEYNAQSCVGIPVDHDQLEGRARRGLAVRVSIGIDHALTSTAPDGQPNTNPNLPGVAVDITPITGPGNGVCTLAGLIQDAYECGAVGELFIHAPAWTLPLFLEENLIVQVGNVWKLGPHTVVLDQGFANESPVGSPPAGAGQAWFYVSGPIEVATGPVTILTDTTGGVSPRLNRANVIAAQLAVYRFDPCCVFAALVGVC